MLTIRIKKYITIIFIVILTCSSCSDGQTFVIDKVVFSDELLDEMSEKEIQEQQEQIKRAINEVEVYLLFSDNDVRMTFKTKNETAEPMILQKIGDNLYRGKEDGIHETVDLKLNTIFGFIRSCEMMVYEKRSMVWGLTCFLKRK